MNKSIVSSAILLALAATPALAAETAEKYSASILGMEGNVLVNQDGSYKTATRGMNLQEGDRVMIMDGAKLSMSYPDGCHFTFKDGQIIEVGSVSVCAMGGTGFVAATTPQYVQAAPGASDDDDAVGAAATSGGAGNAAALLTMAAFAAIAIAGDSGDGIKREQPPAVIPPPPPPVSP